jgi:hypothetical protein
MRTALLLTALLTLSIAANDEVAQWRNGGQASVDQLLANGANEDLLDRVCAQKDCRASRLSGTDLGEAAAKTSGRPILRCISSAASMKAELRDSRFFRDALPDPTISSILARSTCSTGTPSVPCRRDDRHDGRSADHHRQQHPTSRRRRQRARRTPRPTAFAQLEEWLKLDPTKLREYHQGAPPHEFAMNRPRRRMRRCARWQSAIERRSSGTTGERLPTELDVTIENVAFHPASLA